MLLSSRTNERRGQRGSIMAISAFGMLAFLLAVGLCVDISHFYAVKAELQNASDAASLAGASALNSGATGITEAKKRAVQTMNNYEFGNSSVVFPEANVRFAKNLSDFDAGRDMGEADAKTAANARQIRFVRVNTDLTPTKVFFTQLVLGGSHSLAAEATAGMSAPINRVCTWIPLSVVDDDVDTITPGNLYIIRAGPGGNGNRPSPGNYQALSFFSHGGSTLRANLASGIDECLSSGTVVQTEPGVNAGPVRQGLNTRFDDYQGGGVNPTDHPPDTNIAEGITYDQYLNGAVKQSPTHPGVPGRRVVFIPIIKQSEFGNGRDDVRIDRFGVFFLRERVGGGNGGDIMAEYVGATLTIGGGSFDPNGGRTTSVLAIPVLYR
ncbi:MAG: hypothetical protein QOJ76_2846 [Acidobacteriota bacterium]|nr:hypothetical protein [Acidobacteriota bacterium]